MPAARANVCFSGYSGLIVLTLSSSARDLTGLCGQRLADYLTDSRDAHAPQTGFGNSFLEMAPKFMRTGTCVEDCAAP
jgi:hypothetical protein